MLQSGVLNEAAVLNNVLAGVEENKVFSCQSVLFWFKCNVTFNRHGLELIITHNRPDVLRLVTR